jgi:hypothetical protein
MDWTGTIQNSVNDEYEYAEPDYMMGESVDEEPGDDETDDERVG